MVGIDLWPRRQPGRWESEVVRELWFATQDGRDTGIRVRLPVGKYCIIPSTYDVDKEGDFILRVHIEQHGEEEEEEESDTDTLVDLDSRVGTPYVGSTIGRGTISSGTQLYGRSGRGRTTPLYGSRLQLEHVSDNGSERSHR